jgi:hypothetical protein
MYSVECEICWVISFATIDLYLQYMNIKDEELRKIAMTI